MSATLVASPYEHLADLAELELELVLAGRFEELAGPQAEREALVAALPAAPPATAGTALRRAAAAQVAVVDALVAARDQTGHELGRLRRGRGAVRAYGHVPAGSAGTADRRA